MTLKQLRDWFENNQHKFVFYNLKDSNDTNWMELSSTLYNSKFDYKTEWLLNGLIQAIDPPPEAEPFTDFEHVAHVLINKARYGRMYVSINYSTLEDFNNQDREYLFCTPQPRMYTRLFKESTFINNS